MNNQEQPKKMHKAVVHTATGEHSFYYHVIDLKQDNPLGTTTFLDEKSNIVAVVSARDTFIVVSDEPQSDKIPPAPPKPFEFKVMQVIERDPQRIELIIDRHIPYHYNGKDFGCIVNEPMGQNAKFLKALLEPMTLPSIRTKIFIDWTCGTDLLPKEGDTYICTDGYAPYKKWEQEYGDKVKK